MASTSTSSLILLLLLFLQISFLPLASASEDHSDSIERQNADPFYTPDIEPQPQPLQIIPGITKSLLIKLKGQEEEVTFSFRADEADPTVFESLVLVNDKIELTQVSQFPSQELLAVNLDYEAGQCTISGDKGFIVKSAIHEQNYQMDVVHDKGAGYQEQIVEDSTGKENNTLVISATAGACVIVALVVKVAMTARRRSKSVILGDLPARCNTDEDLSKKGPCDSAVITQADCEVEENYKGYIESLTDVPLKNVDAEPIKTPPKKVIGIAKSLASTASTLGIVAPPPKFKKSPPASHQKFTDEDVSESIDVEREHKKEQCKAVVLKSKPQIKKQPFKEEQSNERVELSLDLDLDTDRDPRRAPTIKEIKALVRKMEEEGTIGYDCDPSAESDDEDQYEAPVLPNYFCCMLCFQGKRCTIVQPCRHIFSCTDCVEDLLKSYKICVLCANEITGYEPL